VLTVGRGSEVGIIGSASILGVGNDGVVSLSSLAVIGLLEVSGELVKSETVGQVVELRTVGELKQRQAQMNSFQESKLGADHVTGVKELGDGEVDVFLGSNALLSSVLKVEDERRVGLGSIVMDVIVTSFPVPEREARYCQTGRSKRGENASKDK
jgi:hypothetical protein